MYIPGMEGDAGRILINCVCVFLYKALFLVHFPDPTGTDGIISPILQMTELRQGSKQFAPRISS